MIALATRYAVRTQVASSCVAPRPPAMCGSATLAMEESSTSMNVARVTVMATIQGLIDGRHGFSAIAGPVLRRSKVAVAMQSVRCLIPPGAREIQKFGALLTVLHP